MNTNCDLMSYEQYCNTHRDKQTHKRKPKEKFAKKRKQIMIILKQDMYG